MTVNDIMEFIESEYIVINNTPCEICGGEFITEATGLYFENGVSGTISHCVCSKCGNRKDFLFRAPVSSLNIMQDKEELN